MNKVRPSLVVLLLWLSPNIAGAAPSGLVGRPAPEFVLKGLDGKNLRLSEFRGEVVLINFWARWAGTSRQAVPTLDRIHATYGRAGLVVLGVSIDEDLAHAQAFAAAMHAPYSMLFATGEAVGRDYQIEDLPMTVLIDRGGTVRFVHVGFKRGDDQIYLAEIRELLSD